MEAGHSNAIGNTFALALVVVINWLLAHDATEWVMPPEVQSALQTIISISAGAMVAVVSRRLGRKDPPASPSPAAPAASATS